MKRMVAFSAAAALAASLASGAASAAGEQVCIAGASTPLTTPDSAGHCGAGARLVPLATESEVSSLQAQVTALQNTVATLKEKLSVVRFYRQGVNGLPTLRVAGANLQVVSGSGSTGGPPNGLGNVFIGYDEHGSLQQQTGSHNLVLGEDQAFTSFAGLAVGQHDTLSAPYSAVFRFGNTAAAHFSVVGAGFAKLTIRSQSNSQILPSLYSGFDKVYCLPGEQAVGGGFGVTPSVAVSSGSSPLGNFNQPTVPEGWKTTFWNPTGGTQTIGDTVYVVCAS